MSTSCCCRRKSPREDGPSHQAASCGDNEWLLQSIKGLLRNFRSDQSRWSATTIALRWAALPHQGLNPPQLTKDTRGRCAQEVPDSCDGWQSPSAALSQIHEMKFFCFGFATIKESFKTFVTKRKSAKQIAAFFSFTETLIGKSQMEDERHRDGLCWPCLVGSVGWLEDEELKMYFLRGTAVFHFLFLLSKLCLGERTNNDSSVFNLQIAQKTKQWLCNAFVFFHSYL